MLATIAAILWGCANGPAHSVVSTPAVETLGANSNFAKGDFGSYANLADFRHRRHVYAVGPVQHLGGEVTVIDSVPYAVQVDEDKLEVTRLALIASLPRHRAQRSIFTPNTRFNRRAQFIDTCRRGGGDPASAVDDARALGPRPAGVTAARHRLCDANTP